MRILTLAGHEVDAIILGCVGEKIETKLYQDVPLKDLYCSDLWAKRRAYAEHHAQLECPWFILSAFHGLRTPDYKACTYNRTIADYGDSKTKAWWGRWAGTMLRGMPGLSKGPLVVELHAGADYRKWLQAEGVTFVTPFTGLAIGQQKRWYLDQANATVQADR